jgi:hypothetical protein
MSLWPQCELDRTCVHLQLLPARTVAMRQNLFDKRPKTTSFNIPCDGDCWILSLK